MRYHEESGQRASRGERKRISKKDRSKYKKTDRDKRERSLLEKENKRLLGKVFERGRVLSIAPEAILVESNGKMISCRLRGVLKNEMKKASLLVVGDFVQVEPIGNDEGVILQIEKRKSALAREARLKGKEKVIAANIDQVLITASMNEPPFNIAFIDRTIIATLRGNMKPFIVLNKIDLLSDQGSLEELVRLYEKADIPVIAVSATNEIGLEKLKEVMKGKVSVFVGESGVGKSSLINACAQMERKVKEISQKSKKGVHTTTRAELLPLPFSGWCVDTPGIQIFGFVELSLEDLKNYFVDIEAFSEHCLFPDCTHTHEPRCGVREAVEKGKLSRIRFDSYLSLVKELS